MAVMSDIDEDNFDRAFDLIRPGENPFNFYPLQTLIAQMKSFKEQQTLARS
jgi:hypothetical protein